MAKKIEKIFDKTTGELNPDELINLDSIVEKPEDLELVKVINDRFEQMKQFRESSCPWGQEITSIITEIDDENGERVKQYGNENTSPSKDWARRWKRDRDLAMMKTGKNQFSSALPDVSVPMVLSARNAVVFQYQDSHTSVMIDSMAGVDPIIAKIGKSLIEHVEEQGAMATKKTLVFPESVDCGTAITYNSYVCKKRKVKRIKTIEELLEESGFDDDTLDQEVTNPMTGMPVDMMAVYEAKKAELEESIKKNPTKILVVDEEITDYEDGAMEHVPLEEMFVDPGALDFNCLHRDARDCVWRQWLPIQQLVSDFNNSEDPFVRKENLKKELFTDVGHSIDFDTTDEANQLLLDGSATGNLVEVIRYYNKYTDQFVVIANKKIILRSGPLPYNHKKLPFSKYIFIPIHNSFYGVGFGTMLDNTQTTAEFFKSLHSYNAEYNNNLPKTVVGDTLYQSLKEIEDEPVKAGLTIQKDENDTVEFMPAMNMTFDMDKVRVSLQEDVALIAGLNPQQTLLPNPNMAVRNAQMTSESGLLSIRAYIQNFEHGYVEFCKQMLSIYKQMSPLSYEEIEDDTEEQFENQAVKKQLKKYKSIKMQGVGFTPNNEGQTQMTMGSLKEDSEGSEVELKPEATDKFDKLKVSIKVETTQIASRQLQAQQLNDTLNLAMVIRGNPAFKEDKIINALFKDYLDKKNTPAKILSMFQDDNNKEGVELANLQNELIQQGMKPSNIPGMSENHLLIHKNLLSEKLMEMFELETELKQANTQAELQAQEIMQMQQQKIRIDPNIVDQIQAPMMKLKQERTALIDMIKVLRDHIAGDAQAKTDSTQVAVTQADQILQGGMPQPPQGMLQGMPPQDPQGQQPQEMPMNPMSGI